MNVALTIRRNEIEDSEKSQFRPGFFEKSAFGPPPERSLEVSKKAEEISPRLAGVGAAVGALWTDIAAAYHVPGLDQSITGVPVVGPFQFSSPTISAMDQT